MPSGRLWVFQHGYMPDVLEDNTVHVRNCRIERGNTAYVEDLIVPAPDDQRRNADVRQAGIDRGFLDFRRDLIKDQIKMILTISR